jgi:hypothetical protein
VKRLQASAGLTTGDFEHAQLIEPRRALPQAGADTHVISPKQGQIETIKRAPSPKLAESNSPRL